MTTNVVLGIALGILAGFIAYREISAKLRAAAARREDGLAKERSDREAMMAAMVKLSKSMEDAAAAGIDSAKLLGGTLKACESVAVATTGLREVVAQFTKLVGSKAESGYPEDNYQPPADDAQVNRTAAFIEALGRGVPVDQALQEARDAEEKKTALSAISLME